MKKYLVISEPKGNKTGDSWTEVFDTSEEANEVAERTWDKLTETEKQNRLRRNRTGV